MKRAVSVSELNAMEFEEYNFSDVFKEAFGSPEKNGVWFIWGHSGNGKTRFTLQLAKELTKFGKVAYNSLEEGVNGTMKKAFKEVKMSEVKQKIVLINDNIDDLEKRLDRQKSPDIIIIDSLQYTQLTFKKYKHLKEKYAHKKLLIFTSHAEGKHPRGNTAVSVQYDANMKIWIEGYRAFSKGRFFGTNTYYTIWDVGANKYWE